MILRGCLIKIINMCDVASQRCLAIRVANEVTRHLKLCVIFRNNDGRTAMGVMEKMVRRVVVVSR